MRAITRAAEGFDRRAFTVSGVTGILPGPLKAMLASTPPRRIFPSDDPASDSARGFSIRLSDF